MAGSKVVVCTCIMIFLVISSQADARRLMAATTCDVKEGSCKGGVAVDIEGDGGVTSSKQEMVSATGTEQAGEGMPMTTTDSRPTAPGNSPGIGNRGKINN
ncbi:hypothetical protein SEVIR_6G189300v4 [Setaria viridis]|uniref:Uncharacterized protein n=2 Tax=Setaria TaxID=4554 RepID=K3YL36_SETIT|nr:uncharacterized protein LOC101772475 [Setaria italica]XP_034600788.1 uncharacterized protein LOC117861359 [Setaria viridis]RCV31502.1 hypothetical protein SETIT_6G183100v2 [Setaria italica]TKW10774.1 hypothetical protein SEVIR_6G189300v2 [Setaria viridis]